MKHTTTSRESISYKTILVFATGMFSGASGLILICLAASAFLSGCSTLSLPVWRNNSDTTASCLVIPLPLGVDTGLVGDLRVCQRGVGLPEEGKVTSDD